MDIEIRMVRKRFKCNLCNTKQSKLVQSSDSIINCENCNNLIYEISDQEYNQKTREEVNQNIRMVFDSSNRNNFHTRLDVNDRRRDNIYGDTERVSKREASANISQPRNTPNHRTSNSRINNNNQHNSNSSNNFSNNLSNDNYNRDMNNNSSTNPRTSQRSNPFAPTFENYNIYNSSSTENNQYSNNRNNNNYTSNNNQYNNNQDRSRRRSPDSINAGNIFSNFFGNIRRNPINVMFMDSESNQNNNNNMNIFIQSPFMGRISRHNVTEDIFDPIFANFGMSFNNFFQDNFASNFASNFGGEDIFRDTFYNIRNERAQQESSHPPTSQSALKKLKRFKMNEKYCKKDKSGKLENPSCCICISDITTNQQTVLLPCGHMFHDSCVVEWLKKNNTCPVCRFQLPAER
jgi:hypothetical protein